MYASRRRLIRGHHIAALDIVLRVGDVRVCSAGLRPEEVASLCRRPESGRAAVSRPEQQCIGRFGVLCVYARVQYVGRYRRGMQYASKNNRISREQDRSVGQLLDYSRSRVTVSYVGDAMAAISWSQVVYEGCCRARPDRVRPRQEGGRPSVQSTDRSKVTASCRSVRIDYKVVLDRAGRRSFPRLDVVVWLYPWSASAAHGVRDSEETRAGQRGNIAVTNGERADRQAEDGEVVVT